MQNPPAIKGKNGSIAVLDIGSSKIVCFIALANPDGEFQITGIGHQLARGLRSGIVTDAAELEASIRNAVHSAEQMAGETIENVVVSLSGAHLESRQVVVDLAISGDGVSERDIADLLREGCASIQDKERSVMHCFATQYRLDGAPGVHDPRRMYGSRLGADLHIVTADNVKLRNLAGCIARCHLNVAEFIMASHASALGCLEADERDLGVLLIDMGGGQTSFSLFKQGANLYSGVVPVGGQHVTSDIAQGLSTSLAHAERFKNLKGSAVVAPQDNSAMIDVPLLGDEDETEESNLVPLSMLNGIIRPRLEEIFEMIRERLCDVEDEMRSVRNVVLTGGASQMIGLREMAGRQLARQVRTGRPRMVPGLAESVSGPAFSTAVGMLRYVTDRPMEDRLFLHHKRSRLPGGLHRVTRWFKENF